jgi:hypothetical protein
MPTIFIKDDFRASVEAASGGRQTVLYTAAGHPSVMNIIPAFNWEDVALPTALTALGTGLCSAFKVNGATKSEIFYGTYPGIVKDGNLISLPGVVPTVNQSFDTFRAQVAANGPGWHLTSNAERIAIALWCFKNGFMPRGNNNYGRAELNTYETARRPDGKAPGYTTSGGITLTGSGPTSWRHDNSPFGIEGLNGNVWDWCTGLRVAGGEYQVLADNNAADNTKDVGVTSVQWKAIDGVTGALVTPTFTGTIAGGDYVPTTANSVRLAASGTADYTLVVTAGAAFQSITNPATVNKIQAAAIIVLKQLGLVPVTSDVNGVPLAGTDLGGDYIYHNLANTKEQFPIVGGSWDYGATPAGVFALNMTYVRGNVHVVIGARPAYVL